MFHPIRLLGENFVVQIDWSPTECLDKVLSVVAIHVVIVWLFDYLSEHDPTALFAGIVNHAKGRLELQLSTSSVHMCVLAFEVLGHVLELGFERDRVEMSQAKSQSSAVWQKFRRAE